MQFTVIVHNAEESGYWVEVTSLPGCFSQGETIDEAMNSVKEAIELHIQGLKDEGQAVPKEKDLVIGRAAARKRGPDIDFDRPSAPAGPRLAV